MEKMWMVLVFVVVCWAIGNGQVTQLTADKNNNPINNNATKVKLTLFYESLCPYSISFIVQQLYPVTLHYGDYLNLDLVPYGHCKATQTTDGTWEFKCQHGEAECFGNRVHACSIELGKDKSNTKTVELLACLMNFNYFNTEIAKCLEKSNFNFARYQKCMLFDSTTLEVNYGRRTTLNIPPVKFVPFIMFDDKYNITIEDAAINNLEQVVCDLLGSNRPAHCPNVNSL